MKARRLANHATTAAPIGSRLRRLFALTCCALVCLIARDLPAQAPDAAGLPPQLIEKLAQTGDLTLRNTTLRDALFTIGELWKLNMVVGDDVEGQVNGVFQAAPLSEILDAILLSNGYSYRPVGQSLVILKLEDLGELNPMFETATLALKGGDPEDVVVGARMLNSPRGKIQAIPSARSLLVIDYPDRVAHIRAFVEGLRQAGPAPIDDAPAQLQVTHFSPQFVPATALKDALTTVLSADGKVSILDRENRIVVLDYPPHLRLCEEVLERVDVPRPQVRITAYIYDIAVEDMEQLGFNWNSALQGRYDGDTPQSLWAIDTLTTVPVDGGMAAGAMTLANMSRAFDLQAVILALDSASDSRLLADPNIVVLNNEPAEIAIVQEIPFQQLTQTSGGGDIGTTAFREAGVKLSVIPRIADNGTIMMDVTPEFSRLTGYTPEDNQPIIDRRTARTQVRVLNGHTLVIGGLKQRTDVGEFAGIPYLKDIPKLGFLFRSRSEAVRESELVVFIRPEIVCETQEHDHREAMALHAGQSYLNGIPLGEPCQMLPPIEGPAIDHSEGPPAEAIPTPAGESQTQGELPQNQPLRSPREYALRRDGEPLRKPEMEGQRALARRAFQIERLPPLGAAGDQSGWIAERPGSRGRQ